MIYDNDIYSKSTPELIIELGRRFRQYRLVCKMTQKEVAIKAGLSLYTIKTFESGKALNITMGSFISMLRAIRFLDEMEKLLPDLPPSTEILEKISKQRPKRIRHGE